MENSKTLIVTSFDEKYFNYACVPIKTLGINYSGNERLKVRCLVPEYLRKRESEFIKIISQENLDIKFITSEKYIKFTKSGYAFEKENITKNMHHRLFLGSTFSSYDKVIYIDPDTIVLRDVTPLLNYEIYTPISAVVEYTGMSFRTFNEKDYPYFNNGVFIANLDYWRKENLEDQFVKWIKENGPSECPEQDAMNFVFRNQWAPLPLTFNLLAFKLMEDRKLAENYPEPLIVHFVGNYKPWSDIDIPIWTDKWRKEYSELFQ
ncbi:hypothetical protein N9I52_04310 [Acidimicrobiia bacterium]|nr:hypothetical protein [Acidimicrobiia bacterium]